MIKQEQIPDGMIFSIRPFKTRCEIRTVIHTDSKKRLVARFFINNLSKYHGYNLSDAVLFANAVRAVIEETKKFMDGGGTLTKEEEIRNEALKKLEEAKNEAEIKRLARKELEETRKKARMKRQRRKQKLLSQNSRSEK